MLLKKIKEFSTLVFQDNTSKNQDFFRTFQDQWEPCNRASIFICSKKCTHIMHKYEENCFYS